MEITITEEDRELGIRRDCWNCPVARALWRATGVKWRVLVGWVKPLDKPGAHDEIQDGLGKPLRPSPSSNAYYLRLPDSVSNWQQLFDYPEGGLPPVPFIFTLPDADVARVTAR